MNKYVNGDCLDVMQEMIDNKVKIDCVITDPPYGINYRNHRGIVGKDSITAKCLENDDADNLKMLAQSLELANKLMKDESHIYWFTRWDKLHLHYPLLDKYFKIKNLLIWNKGNGNAGDLFCSYRTTTELIIFGMKGRKQLNKIGEKTRHDDMLNYSRISSPKLIHPTQKPVELFEFLLLKSTNENEIALDMFGGVGTLLIPCQKNKRNGISIELDENYYNSGIQYLNNNKVEFCR